MRRRVVSPVLRLLLWLAYLSASSVAIFVLGHLAVHAGGPRHQLLFFWAPFTLLHLGGPDSITAFSRQDSELWKRHLLGLVSQIAVSGYVVSRSSWPDRRLLAAMVLMFLSGSYKYAELTLFIYLPSPARVRQGLLRHYLQILHSLVQPETDDSCTASMKLQGRFCEMLKVDGRQPPEMQYDEAVLIMVYDTPPNETQNILGADYLPGLLGMVKSSADRCRAYDYASVRLAFLYECLYTKVTYHATLLSSLRRVVTFYESNDCSPKTFVLLLLFCLFRTALLLLPFPSSLTALVLFMAADKGQQYSRADAIVSYILLIGAIILELASLFISILSCYFISTGEHLVSHVAKNIHPTWRWRRKQWSEMLPQYSMVNTRWNIHRVGIMSFLPEWIGKHLDDKTLTHIHITQGLKTFVLDKLLDFGTGDEQNWKFSSFRGQLALQKWMHIHEGNLVSARLKTALHESINGVDMPTSVLIWHIATDICYSRDGGSDQVKQMSREISNYIMYLVFKCGVMATNSTDLLHHKALTEMEKAFDNCISLEKIFPAHKSGHQSENTENSTSSNSGQVSQLQLVKNSMKDLDSPFLPRAFAVADDLDGISGEANRWNFIAAVWLEMLYYIAPRCGANFHSEHLSTGGEFVTHILMLMRILGPFLPPPSGGFT